MLSTAPPRGSRAISLALAAMFWFTPLWATLAALDPERPPFPVLASPAIAAAFAIVALLVFAVIAVAALRTQLPFAVRFGFLGGGLATLLSGVLGFDPILGIGIGLGVTGVGIAGLALSAADATTAHACVRAFLWSSLCASLVALAMLVTRRPLAPYEYDNGRAVGTFLNPNELAAFTIAALGLALPLAAYSRSRLATATSLVLCVTLAATFSRWGMFSAVCGAATFALSIGSRRLLAVLLAIGVCGGAVSLALGAEHHNPVDTQARSAAWRAGWTTFLHFPLLGVGPLAFARTYEAFRPPDAPGSEYPIAYDPHSVPLAFAASGGVVALFTLIGSAAILQRRVYRSVRSRASEVPRMVALGLAAGVVGLEIQCLTNTIVLFFPLGYLGVALALAIANNDAV